MLQSLNPTAHNIYRKRTQGQKDTTKAMTHAGVRPMQIMAALQKEDPDTLVSATDIRSEGKAIREKHLNGRSPIETLLDDLSTSDWVFTLKRDSDNHVQCLFFTHQKQIELLLANPDVLLMEKPPQRRRVPCEASSLHQALQKKILTHKLRHSEQKMRGSKRLKS
ncbi:uncharacterized protein PV09_09559 [Verruconis gallopava]|uniref:Uncharacterized protein n=1 Tax=Verruconis gallopava TaxID=253628 RepID=A0A0D1ZX96_9PEZI|nr:uncharacterized protein PV09_09559 [Verruconis gallopava]KIV98679.1 hypothetical protein PV09_09559 [Verruconis gallopava]